MHRPVAQSMPLHRSGLAFQIQANAQLGINCTNLEQYPAKNCTSLRFSWCNWLISGQNALAIQVHSSVSLEERKPMEWKPIEARTRAHRVSPRAGLLFVLLAASTAVTTRPATAQAPAPIRSAAWHTTSPNRLISAQVSDGVLTVDGMVGKIDLNYAIQHTGFLYFFEPGVGTAVVSLSPLAGAEKVTGGFDGSKLAFTVEGHSFELSCARPMLSRRRNKEKADIYVRLDASTAALSRYPKMGYGDTTEPPYIWPLSQPEPVTNVHYAVTPPPMPRSVLPETVDTAYAIPSSSH